MLSDIFGDLECQCEDILDDEPMPVDTSGVLKLADFQAGDEVFPHERTLKVASFSLT